MDKSVYEYDLEEAQLKQKILIHYQKAGPGNVISYPLIKKLVLKDIEMERVIHLLEEVSKRGFITRFKRKGDYEYDLSGDRFLLKGGFIQEFEDKNKLELGKNIGSLFESVLSNSIKYNISEEFCSISDSLNRIVKELEGEDKNWMNVGNSCRITLQEFVKELYKKNKIYLGDDVKRGDVKANLRNLVTNKTDPGKFRDSLKKLIEGIWDHSQPVLHTPATTKEEALRTFIWTTLCINEIVTLLKST